MLKRMKRSVVLLATAALLITALAPAGLVSKADAYSKNEMSKVVTVKSGTDLEANYPVLKLRNDNPAGSGWTGTQIFRLTLDGGAKWSTTISSIAVVGATATSLAAAEASPGVIGTTDATPVTVSRVSDETVEITAGPFAWTTNDFIYVPMKVKTGGAQGEYKVTVSNWGTNITDGVYTYAVVGTGGTVASAGTPKNISRQTIVTGSTITIDEAYAGSVTVGTTFTARLPYGYEWNTTRTTVVGTNRFPTPLALDKTNDGRDLLITLATPAGGTNTVRSSMFVTPVFTVKNDAKQGDVLVQIIGKDDVSDASDLKIATYKDFGIAITAKEVKTLIAGNARGDFKTADVMIKETAPGSFIANRPIDLTLPAFVNFTTGAALTWVDGGNAFIHNSDGYAKDKLQLDWSAAGLNGLQSDGDLKYFTVKVGLVTTGDYCDITKADSKDIALKVAHAGVTGVEGVIAKAVPPFVVTNSLTDVKLGLQGQLAGDITIKEVIKGSIDKWGSSNTHLFIDAPAMPGFYFVSYDSLEVTDGDLSLDTGASGVTSSKKALDIVVKGASSKPSTIVIKGVKISTDRTTPEGKLALRFGPNGAVNDVTGVLFPNDDWVYSTFSTYCGSLDFVNMITPAERDLMAQSQFTIGSTTYKMLIDGVWTDKTMDAAPYILNGRTMVPFRFVGEALGATVSWDDQSNSAILMKSGIVCRVQPNSDILLVNGTPIKMDVKVVSKGGRLYLPVSQVGLALNATSSWDAATQTATFTVYPR